ncbi:hypothetical protein I3760_15G026900 [Carya illinoinensis]|nr:hypothetical protein I3760_15G026900 [Carya illinoinensis]
MATSAVAAAHKIALPNCPDHCGDVPIPYPFGTSDDCSLNEDFFINCNQSSTGRDQPQIGVIVVPNISVELGQLEILLNLSRECYNESRMLSSFWQSGLRIKTSTFTISNTENIFMAVGCDTFAYLHGRQYNGNFSMGCMSICRNESNVLNGTCSGIGCCQVEIPKKVSNFSLQASSFAKHSEVLSFNPCSYAFIVKKGLFNFNSDNLTNIEDNRTLPMVLDWTIGNETCANAKINKREYLCGANSTCYNPENGYGYRCSCNKGYEGNPYLPQGCEGTSHMPYTHLSSSFNKFCT